MDRDPRESIIRKVLLYPASGEEPHIVDMTFSEAGSCHPHAIYSRSVDLRLLHKRCMAGVRVYRFGATNQADSCDDGEYIIYFNIDPKLPLNRSVARVLGVDPAIPMSRPIHIRGDAVVVKTQEWPGPLVVGGGAHMDYLDVQPSARLINDRMWVARYADPTWDDFMQEEQHFCE